MQRRIDVVSGPGADIDASALGRWCKRWSEELDVRMDAVTCASATDTVAALERAGDAVGAVVCPGDVAVAPLVEAADRAGIAVAWVELGFAEAPRPAHLEDPEVIGVRGRGIMGFRWATGWLLQRLESPCEVVRYGSERDQVGDLRLPAGDGGPAPVAVLLHGGFWRERWERDTIEPLAIDLARRGVATWNLEYRRTGPFGGGWPATCEDVAAGIDHLRVLADRHALDLDRVVLVGHSAGGQLALWAVHRRGVEAAGPALRPSMVVSLAGIGDMAECAHRGLGDTGNAAADFMGGPAGAAPDAYAAASPQASLPLGVPQLVAQGELDNTADLVDMNVTYTRAAQAAGDEIELLLWPDVDHFDLIVPTTGIWQAVADRIAAHR